MIPYDPELPIVLACDTSPTGIVGVLSHIIEGVERPISFASRSLTKAEMNYSQLDREALAIIFAVDKFFMYVYSRKFKLITDNRPLTRIFHHNTKIPAMTAGRLLRYASFLSTFDYEIEHRKTEDHTNVDYFSRVKFKSKATQEHPLSQETTEIHDQVINPILLTNITYKSIAEETSKDLELVKLKDKLRNESIIDTKFELQNGIIFKGNRVVIPVILQKHVLAELHHTHVGVVKMKQLARRYCWWKNIDKDIENLVKACQPCALVKKNPQKAPIHAWNEPTENFERIHIDYAGEFQGHHFLILVDAKSKWLEVKIIRNAPTTEVTIHLLQEIFSFHGFPRILVSDNATIFSNEAFTKFCNQNGICQKFSSRASRNKWISERNVQTVKNKFMSMSTLPNSITDKVQEILFRYRATPLACGKSPAELYLGRRLRIKLDALKPYIDKTSKKVPENPTVRQLRVGERVQVRWWSRGKAEWKFGIITKELGRLHYEVRLDSGYTLKKHINQLRSTYVKILTSIDLKESQKKKVTFADDMDTPSTKLDLDLIYNNDQPNGIQEPETAPEVVPAAIPELEDDEPDIVLAEPVIRRTERVRRPPSHFKDYLK